MAERRITLTVDEKTLKKLHDIADDRSVSLKHLSTRIIEWAAEQDPLNLARIGIQLPVYLGEIDNEKDRKVEGG